MKWTSLVTSRVLIVSPRWLWLLKGRMDVWIEMRRGRKEGHVPSQPHHLFHIISTISTYSSGGRRLVNIDRLIIGLITFVAIRRFDCGSGTGKVRSEEPVLLNQWNTVTIYRHRWDAWLVLNQGNRIQGRSKVSIGSGWGEAKDTGGAVTTRIDWIECDLLIEWRGGWSSVKVIFKNVLEGIK